MLTDPLLDLQPQAEYKLPEVMTEKRAPVPASKMTVAKVAAPKPQVPAPAPVPKVLLTAQTLRCLFIIYFL